MEQRRLSTGFQCGSQSIARRQRQRTYFRVRHERWQIGENFERRSPSRSCCPSLESIFEYPNFYQNLFKKYNTLTHFSIVYRRADVGRPLR